MKLRNIQSVKFYSDRSKSIKNSSTTLRNHNRRKKAYMCHVFYRDFDENFKFYEKKVEKRSASYSFEILLLNARKRMRKSSKIEFNMANIYMHAHKRCLRCEGNIKIFMDFLHIYNKMLNYKKLIVNFFKECHSNMCR